MKAPAQIAAALCLMALTTNASATLLTFDEFSAINYPDTYRESGYIFTMAGGGESPSGWHLGDGTRIPETLNWHGAPGGANSRLLVLLTKEDGGLFDLIDLDIDVASIYDVLGVSAPGYLEQTFDRTVDDQALHFIGVSQVIFRHVRGIAVGIDNVLVRPSRKVPEPTTLALLSIGLAGIGLSRRRKKV